MALKLRDWIMLDALMSLSVKLTYGYESYTINKLFISLSGSFCLSLHGFLPGSLVSSCWWTGYSKSLLDVLQWCPIKGSCFVSSIPGTFSGSSTTLTKIKQLLKTDKAEYDSEASKQLLSISCALNIGCMPQSGVNRCAKWLNAMQRQF